MKKIQLAALVAGSAMVLGYFVAPFIFNPKEENKSQAADEEHSPHHAVSLPREDLQPFLEKHCIQCHGPKNASGVSVGVLFLVSLLQYKEARLFSVVVVFLVYAKNPCTWYIFSASHNTYV